MNTVHELALIVVGIAIAIIFRWIVKKLYPHLFE